MKISQPLSLLFFVSFALFLPAQADPLPAITLTAEEVSRLGISCAVLAAQVVADPIPLTGELTIDPSRRQAIGSFFSGQIRRSNQQVGEEIIAGQELFRLRSREVGEVIANYLEKAEHLATATTLYEREKSLRERKLTTEDAYLDAFSDFREARVAHASTLQMALLIRSSEELAALQQGGLTERFTDLSLVAPFTGVVIEKMKSAGDAVAANEVLCEVADLTQLLVEVRVPLQAMERVKIGEMITFHTVLGNPRQGSATVTRINPVARGQSLTATVYAALSNEGQQWRVGTPITASLLSPKAEVKAAVAAGAVVTIDGEPHLFLAEGQGRYRPVAVDLGARSQLLVEVVAGLAPGAKVVTQRASLLLAAYFERVAE